MLRQAGNCPASVFQYQCRCNSGQCTNTTLTITDGLLRDGDVGLVHGLDSCRTHFRTVIALVWVTAATNVLFVVLEAVWRWPFARAWLSRCATRAKAVVCPSKGPYIPMVSSLDAADAAPASYVF